MPLVLTLDIAEKLDNNKPRQPLSLDDLERIGFSALSEHLSKPENPKFPLSDQYSLDISKYQDMQLIMCFFCLNRCKFQWFATHFAVGPLAVSTS